MTGKLFHKYLFFLFLTSILFIQDLSAQIITRTSNIVQAEGYWDTDPGQGSAIAFSATDGSFNSEIEKIIQTTSTSSLSNGGHTFYVRVKDNDNNWGPVFGVVVNIQTSFPPVTNTRTSNIILAEGFWDTDPGQGNGIVFLASDGSFNSEIEKVIQTTSTSSLSNGGHTFYVRVKDNDNNWGPVFGVVVNIQTSFPPVSNIRTSNIVQAEGFWDTDPGAGNGIIFLAADGSFNSEIEHVIQTTSTASLSNGGHTFYVRVKDNDNNWGPTFGVVVNVQSSFPIPPNIRTSNIVLAEGFWDTDPGAGNGIVFLAADGSFNSEIEHVIQTTSTASLSNGGHTFYVRVKDNDNNWGPTFGVVVNVQSSFPVPPNIRSSNIVQAEGFWDTDPGQGNGIVFLAADGSFNSEIENVIQTTSTASLSNGGHTFYVRVKDNDNNWGPVFGVVVNIQSSFPVPPNTRASSIVQAVGYWNTDPGQGNGIAFLASDGSFDTEIENLIKAVPTNALSTGMNTFYVRTKDND
ncbi:MAG: hypothetical protein IAF38_04380, partial [Bacteroidia bacterium]|nr:hypothetical protein [Bacteroidia bacterium]